MASARRVGTNEHVTTYGSAGQGRDYTSLSTWEAATDNDLVTAAQSEVLECYRDAASFTDNVTVAGATTSSSYFRIIRPAAAYKHNGLPGVGIKFSRGTGTGSTIQGNENYFQLQDVEVVRSASATGNVYCVNLYTGVSQAAVGVIAKATNSGTGLAIGIAAAAPSAGEKEFIIDCLAYECKSQGILATCNAGATYVYNSSAVGNGYGCGMVQGGAGSGGTVYLRNVLSSGNTTADFTSDEGTFTEDVAYCASSDATADDWGGTGNRVSQTFTFINSGADDYRRTAADAGARGYGTSLSADGAYAFDDDIMGRTRFGSWDIGAYQVPTLTCAPQAFALATPATGLKWGRKLVAAVGLFAFTGVAAGLTYTPVGGATYTLTAAAGGYTATGQAATLRTGRKLVASPGAYAYAGQATGLRAGRKLTAAPQAYTATGQAAGLRRSWILGASPGAYQVAGQAADLRWGRILATSPQGYLVTGQSAGLRRSWLLAASPQGYSVTGQAAAFRWGHILAAGPQGYAVAGQAAGLRWGRILTAGVGLYTLDTRPVGLVYTQAGHYTLVVEPASYAVAGQAAALKTGRILTASPGEYEVTGQAAGLRVGWVLVASPQGYVVTGQATELRRSLRIVVDPGGYVLTGVAASLTAGRILGALPGLYVVTGQAAGLVYSGAPGLEVERTVQLWFEARGVLVKEYTLPLEALGGLSRTLALWLESLQGGDAEYQLFFESLEGVGNPVSRVVTLPLESLASPESTRELVLESLASVLREIVLPFEARSGGPGVARTVTLRFESLAQPSRIITLPLEARAPGVTVGFVGTIPMPTLAATITVTPVTPPGETEPLIEIVGELYVCGEIIGVLEVDNGTAGELTVLGEVDL